MEWSRHTQQGDAPTPRAGHAGVTIGENWYIVGGGDNKSGMFLLQKPLSLPCILIPACVALYVTSLELFLGEKLDSCLVFLFVQCD